MLTDQLVSFQTAVLAKEKGFDVPTCRAYDGSEMLCTHCKEPFERLNYNRPGGTYASCPSQSLLSRWLRDKHKLQTCVLFLNGQYTNVYTTDSFPTYELAKDDVLAHVLNLLS